MSPRFWQDTLKFSAVKPTWLVRAGWALTLAGSAPSAMQAAPPQFAPANSAYYTQSEFAVPFQVKPGGRCPQNLDLLVSRDGGRSWQVHQSVAPAEGRFRFAQAEEGEYWLKVQVRDAAGSALSHSTMHVIVDRTRPTASFLCDWQGENKLFVSCRVNDPSLDPQSIQLQLRTDVDNAPKPLELQHTGPSREGVESQAALEMPACKSFELRLVAVDRAGNKTVTSERFFHPLLADEHDALLPPAVEEPVEAIERQMPTEVTNTEWTAIELGAPKSLTKTQLASVPRNKSVVRIRPERQLAPPQELIPPEKPDYSAAIAGKQSSELTATELSLEGPMPPQTPSHVVSATKKLQIQYKLNEAQTPEQLHVELWVTTDSGATWEFWGLDRDAQSPAAVEVNHSGQFGFCVVCVHSEADFQYRPRPGDRPDLVVTVNEPEVRRRLQAAAP